MADNKYPWVKHLEGAYKPQIFPGKVQAGSTQAIKRGEICAFNETSGYWVPVDAAADYAYPLAIANEEQKSDDSERYMEFLALRLGDVFEFEIDSSAQVELGDGMELTASDSQKLTRDVDGNAVAHVVGIDNYPETGTTLGYRTYAQVVFNAEFSYWEKNVRGKNLVKVMAKTEAYTLKLEDCGAIVTNKGADGAVVITAPNAVVPVGWNVKLACMAGQELRFVPKPETAQVYIKGAAQAAGKYASVTDEGDFMHLVWDGTDWLCYASISGADADITIET